MRKLFMILVAGLLMVACGHKESSTEETSTAETMAEAPAPALVAEKVLIGNLYYNLYDDNTAEVVRDDSYRTSPYLTLTIPSKTRYEYEVYTVTSIGNCAFSGCANFTAVEIPNSVTNIEDAAFDDCTGLTAVEIPNSVTHIGKGAFSRCSNLYVPIYNKHVFAYMPTSYKGAYAIPHGIKQIAGKAFYNCTGLTSVTIPNTVTSIGDYAFDRCTGLRSITIPNSVTYIGAGALGGIDFSVPIYNEHVFVFLPYSYEGAYAIPQGIKQIAGGAFSERSGLTSITIPNSVTRIDVSAFEGCRNLTSLTIPNSVKSIGSRAFEDCTGLTSVTISNGVIAIGMDAFRNCRNLTSLTIPNSVQSIGIAAFGGCTGLTSVTLPTSIQEIGANAFYGCTNLQIVYEE